MTYLLQNPTLIWIFPQPLLQKTFRPRSQSTRLPMVTQVSPNLLTHPLVLVQLHQAPLGLVQSLLPLIRRLPLLVVIRLTSINRLHDLVILRRGEGGVQ